MDPRLERLIQLWMQEAGGLKQPYQNDMKQGVSDPMSAILGLQSGYGRNVDPGMLLRFAQQGQGMQQQQGMPDAGLMQLIQALLGQQQQGMRR